MNKANWLLKNIKTIKNKYRTLKIAGEENLELKKIILIFNNCQEALTKEEREVLKLKYFDELTHVEAAETLLCCYNTIANVVRRIKNKFNHLLRSVEIDQELV